jgi:acetylornithine deacetylase/succinyl-diaminopimelate desuccinylase-like protein
MLRSAALLAMLAFAAEPALATDYDAAAQRARSLLEALVAANTSNPPGNEARAAALGAERLAAAGISSERIAFAPGRENLVARLPGDGSQPPLLLLAHSDVVGAEGQAWSSDPHLVVEKDGFLVGRGVNDDLGMAALILEVLLLLHAEKTPLARDVILAWTGDEESGGSGVRHLLAEKRGAIDAAFALNEGGMIRLGEDGRPTWIELQTAEKSYQDYVVVARGETGHSSVPLPENAIYRLASALTRLEGHRFPARLLPVSRAHFAARAPFEPPERARAMRALADAKGALPADALAVLDADPVLQASLRTTCVATLLSAGTRVNALPAEAQATINCRILPDETAEDVQQTLARVFADPSLAIEPTEEFGFGTPSPLEGPVPAAIASVAGGMWPGLPVIPFMSRGATDSRFVRAHGIPAYGIDPIPMTEDDARRAHGIDERIEASGLRTGVEFLHRVVLALAARPAADAAAPGR